VESGRSAFGLAGAESRRSLFVPSLMRGDSGMLVADRLIVHNAVGDWMNVL